MFGRVVFVVLALFVSSVAFAQDQLAGVVRDSSGAVVSGATIVVRQTSSTFRTPDRAAATVAGCNTLIVGDDRRCSRTSRHARGANASGSATLPREIPLRS